LSNILQSSHVQVSIPCLLARTYCPRTGGNGRFRLLLPHEYDPQNEVDWGLNGPGDGGEVGLCGMGSWTDAGCIRTPPFTVYPSYFSLKKGESVELTIEFVPLTLGNLTADFYMVCDNRQVRSFSLRACSRQIDISVVEINNTRYDRKITDLASDLHFTGVTVQTEKTQQLVLCNDTGIPIEFEWVWIPSSVGIENTQAEARKVLW
jgi:hypothetical protein